MTRYLSLAEYFWLAEQVTGTDATTLAKASRLELADSALHAPAASFGGEEFYPDILVKAAVLTCRLAWNHLSSTATSAPPGRHLYCSSILMDWSGTPIPPDVDQSEAAMLAVAAREVDESWLAAWLRERTRLVDQGSERSS